MANCVSLWSSENRFKTGSPLFFFSRETFLGKLWAPSRNATSVEKKVNFHNSIGGLSDFFWVYLGEKFKPIEHSTICEQIRTAF